MALFERDRLPSRSTLSRFLAALTEAPVDALRTLFLDDLLSRPLTHDKQTGGLVDRARNAWVVFDIDVTREAARQRALPQTEGLPPPSRRLDDVCAAGYTGRKRGQVVQTRTVISQAHSFQWLGSFGNRGNGRYREELRQGLAAIGRYLAAHQLPQERALLRLDGQYGTGAVLSDLAGFSFVTRGKDYAVLDHPLVQARLLLPPDQFQQRPESQMVRSLYDCLEVPVGPEGVLCRVVVATHPAGKQKSAVGVTRSGVVYELFFTNLPPQAFTASDVVEVYLHRGAFEPALADEDAEHFNHSTERRRRETRQAMYLYEMVVCTSFLPSRFFLELLKLSLSRLCSQSPGECLILLAKPAFSLLSQGSLGGNQTFDQSFLAHV